MPSDCDGYYVAQPGEFDSSLHTIGSNHRFAGDTCQAIADKYSLTVAQFEEWNVSLIVASCQFLLDTADLLSYSPPSGRLAMGCGPATHIVSRELISKRHASLLPVRSLSAGIHRANVTGSNPAPSTSAPKPTGSPAPTLCGTVAPPAPTQSGIPCNCNKFAVPQPGVYEQTFPLLDKKSADIC